MMIVLNGERAEISGGETLAGVLDGLGVLPGQRGVAVAVDGEVVPRAQWSSFELPEDARVEVLSAMQGG
jgi:sulfur carrier protein